MPWASWWLALGWCENYSCCRFLSFHFLLMTAAFRVLQLVVTYTYITGSDKSAIKCGVLLKSSSFLRLSPLPMPWASWWLALGWCENYSCCRFLSFHFLLMTAAFRVLQLVVTYTYITGSDKSAIKCRVLFSRFWRFKKCVMNLSKKEKRKQGRKREGRGKWKKAREKKGKGKRKHVAWTIESQGHVYA